jgi:hypothetical protein
VLKVHTHLYAPPSPQFNFMGMSHSSSNGCPTFTLIPRKSALSVLPKIGVDKTYDSLSHILSTHRVSLSRGHSKTIFCDPNDSVMYKCFGVRPGRNSRGVLDCDKWMERIDAIHWRRVMKMVMRAELLLESFADQEVIDRLRVAKHVVPFKTMHAPKNHRAYTHIPHAKYFGAIAFGRNVFLRCHTDDDFTLSVAHVLLGGKQSYSVDDPVVVYFCFPTEGVAMPMRPGDFLLFNARVPHCISSQCSDNDDIMCISMFLKTSVVGGDDNGVELNDIQQSLSDLFRATQL